MEENRKLRNFLVRTFLITLVLIGLAQIIVGLLTGTFLNPLIEKSLSLDGMLSEKDVRETYLTILQALFIFVVQEIAGAFSPVGSIVAMEIMERIFGESSVGVISNITDGISGQQEIFYIIRIILLFLLVLIIWLLPYIIGGITFARIVTRKVDAIEMKRKERDRENEKQRNLLLSDVAHDIKTPITTVAGFSQALAEGAVAEEKKQEYLEAVHRKSLQISDLVSLLFEYVKLDSAGYELKKTTEDLCEVVRGCVAKLYTDFEEKNMEMDINIPDESIWVRIDKLQFERSINNILLNTIKHNPEGTKVFVEIKMEKREAVILLSDKGNFIDSETAKHLFDPFVQGDKSRTSASGSGLGLSITKKIVEMHGGTIRLIQYKNNEKYGKTKTFEIRLLSEK